MTNQCSHHGSFATLFISSGDEYETECSHCTPWLDWVTNTVPWDHSVSFNFTVEAKSLHMVISDENDVPVYEKREYCFGNVEDVGAEMIKEFMNSLEGSLA